MLIKFPIKAEDKYKCKYCGCVVLPKEKFVFCEVQGQQPFAIQYKPHVFTDNKNSYISIVYWCNCDNATFIKKKWNNMNNTFDQIYTQIPPSKHGLNVDIKKISKKISEIYDEIDKTFSSNCLNAFFLLCRTLVVEIAQYLIDKKKIFTNNNLKSCNFFDINKLLEDSNFFGEVAKDKFEMIRKIGNDKCHNTKKEWDIDLDNDNAKKILEYLNFLLNQLYFEATKSEEE